MALRLDIRHLRKIDSACSNVIISYIFIDISLEKIKVFNENSKILQQISSVRECIDKQCTCCLETLVKLHLDNKGKDYIEFEYQKSVQRFNRFLDEVMNMNVWKYIDKYNNIFIRENL